ncbi:MAG: hypothetical protein JSS97_17200 [Actinobacteria bacterium]|nr:hypothetical protein [Actinomycetota bacterium]
MRVNALAPGPTDTGALDRSGLPAETVAAIDRAEAAATWITGQVVDVDAGAGLVGHPSVAAAPAEGCQ